MFLKHFLFILKQLFCKAHFDRLIHLCLRQSNEHERNGIILLWRCDNNAAKWRFFNKIWRRSIHQSKYRNLIRKGITSLWCIFYISFDVYSKIWYMYNNCILVNMMQRFSLKRRLFSNYIDLTDRYIDLSENHVSC